MQPAENAPKSRLLAKLAGMSLREKVALLSGQDFWTVASNEAHGIGSLRLSDGPTGLRSVNSDPATVFPVGSSLAATWKVDLAAEVSAAIATEAKAHDVDVLLGPALNIQRPPLAGRTCAC